MKKFLSAAAVVLALCSCASHKAMDYGFAVNSFKGMQSDTMTVQQVDSMIEVDALPALAKWQSSVFADASTNVNRKYYTLFNSGTKIVYTVKELKAGNLYYTVKKGVAGSK